jgi:hypothetical protein
MSAALGAYLIMVVAVPAFGAKWQTCPAPPLPVYPSIQGATTAPFIHPGHDLTIVLNTDEVAAGGFSLAPDGNSVAIEFHSLFGQSVSLPSFAATASSPNVLTFAFPDTALAGPADVQVTAGDEPVAHINWTDLVALPPTNDVTPIVLGQDDDTVLLGALSADGDVWIPARFQGEPMAMPSCPGDFIVPVPIQVAAAEIVGAPPAASNPLGHIRQLDGYLGDVMIRDYNFYGMLLPTRINLVHVGGTLGVSLCRINDAIDVVLRVHGDASWARSRTSPFRIATTDSAPVPLRVIAARLNPSSDPNAQSDSFGADCSVNGSAADRQ